MSPAPTPRPATRLPYDDAASPQQMIADGRVAGERLRLDRAAESALSGRRPSLHFDDYPREVRKRDIRVSDAAARIARALYSD